jgi:hypothetical protein
MVMGLPHLLQTSSVCWTSGLLPAGASFWYVLPLIVIATVLRIHSEIDCLLALAALAIDFRSSGAKRTGTILPFASPFGSLGRPILAFFCAKVLCLLHDCGSYRILSRFNGMKMEHRDVSNWFVWIVCLMRPRIDSVRRGVPC